MEIDEKDIKQASGCLRWLVVAVRRVFRSEWRRTGAALRHPEV